MIRDIIENLPLSANIRLKMFNSLRRFEWKRKLDKVEYQKRVNRQTFIPSNSYYGHEYWLKRYSNYYEDIYGLIEHGLYFGEDESKVGFKTEWEIGNIITYGDYRAQLLRRLYPNFNIETIGPRIHYADIDMDYYNELKSKIDVTKKTMTIFPAHSLAGEQAYYAIDKLISNVKEISDSLGITNLLISLHPADLIHGLQSEFEKRNLVVVSSGTDEYSFLPRQKAIYKISDLTYSNSLGTHIGYSIYMRTPHILKPETMILRPESDMLSKTFYREEADFAKMFSGTSDPFKITSEQLDFYDYYFGEKCIKSPEDLNKMLERCKRTF